MDNGDLSLVLFEKTVLLDTATPPEQTSRNRIHLGDLGATNYNYNLVVMNTTSIVLIQQVTGQENQGQDYLCKKDFWISRTNTA